MKRLMEKINVNELDFNNYLSDLEIDYLIDRIRNNDDTKYGKDTTEILISKLNHMKNNIKNCDQLQCEYLKNHIYHKAGDFEFEYDPNTEYYSVYDNKSGQHAMEVMAGLYNGLYTLSDYFSDVDSAEQRYNDQIRFCTLCGKPMIHGYTNDDMYICDDSEFYIYMDKVYGAGDWRAASEEELHVYDACYMYKDNCGTWRPTDWYLTDWYE